MEQELGKVTVSSDVFMTLASKAAIKVEGVARFGSSLSEMVTSFIKRNNHQGISVEIGTVEVAIDIRLVVEYGYNLVEVGGNVQRAVIEEIETLTGYHVAEVTVAFVGINLPEETSSNRQPLLKPRTTG